MITFFSQPSWKKRSRNQIIMSSSSLLVSHVQCELCLDICYHFGPHFLLIKVNLMPAMDISSDKLEIIIWQKCDSKTYYHNQLKRFYTTQLKKRSRNQIIMSSSSLLESHVQWELCLDICYNFGPHFLPGVTSFK